MHSYVKIIRPLNSVVSGLTAVIACIISGVTEITAALLMFFVVALICSAGNTINDYFDSEIDKINRPKRPIPSGKVSRRGALIWSLILFSAGFAISIHLNNFICIIIALANILILIIYAAKLKGVPFVGNIAVAYLSGSIFIFGGALSGEFLLALPLASVTFFGTVAREILKDAEDIEGDSACGAKTLPMIIGLKLTELLAVVYVFAAVFFTLIPYFVWGVFYLVPIFIVDAFMIFTAVRSLKFKTPSELKNSKSTTLLKIGMFSALAVFLVMALLFSLI